MEENLIVEVEKRPVLYDKSLVIYKNSNYREEQWKEVASELKTDDINGVKKRWRSLRDTFIKMYKAQKLPSGLGGGKKLKWSYYSQMTFLIPYIEFREIMGNYSDNSPVKETECIEKVFRTPEHDNEQVEYNITLPNSNNGLCYSKKCKHVVVESKNDINEKLVELITKETDADEQFLLSHIPVLKRLTPKQNAIAKMKIQQVLFDIEFGNQNNYLNSSLSGHSEYSSTPSYESQAVLSPLQTNKSIDNGLNEFNYFSSQL